MPHQNLKREGRKLKRRERPEVVLFEGVSPAPACVVPLPEPTIPRMRGGTVVLAILLGAVSTACGVSRDGGGLASVGDAVVSPREAYVTLVTTPSYAIGAQTLAKVGVQNSGQCHAPAVA